MKDINEKKRDQLTQQINHLDSQEEDLLFMKNRYEEQLSNFYAEMQSFNARINYLLDSSPGDSLNTQRVADNNWTLQQTLNQYMDEEFDYLAKETRKVRRNLDDKRESLIVERSRLPWE